MIHALTSFSNNKLLAKYGLIKEFYETFWTELKETLINSINQTKISKNLITWQKQPAIKLIEKKNIDKRFIKNRSATSLLNVDYKII